MPTNRIYSSTYNGLDIRHQMIKAGSDYTDQLTTRINCRRVWPLIIAPVPLLCALLHLSCVVGSQRQTLEMTTSGHGTRGNKVVQGETIERTKGTPRTLHSLIDCLGGWITPIGIVTGGPGILDVVPCLETLKALRPGIVDVLGVGDGLRRRRSVGSRHFDMEDGLMV